MHNINKIIYTVNFGGYDKVKPIANFKGWHRVIFSDVLVNGFDECILVNLKGLNAQKESRRYKWLIHKYYPNASLYCYLDASMVLLRSPMLNNCFVRHPKRNNIEIEGNKILELNKANLCDVYRQINDYKNEGFKDNLGLYQNGFFVRENNSEINILCELVWLQVENFTNRDQLALPYCLWKLGIKLKSISAKEANRFILIHSHNSKFQQK
jgi:hypothetical protein